MQPTPFDPGFASNSFFAARAIGKEMSGFFVGGHDEPGMTEPLGEGFIKAVDHFGDMVVDGIDKLMTGASSKVSHGLGSASGSGLAMGGGRSLAGLSSGESITRSYTPDTPKKTEGISLSGIDLSGLSSMLGMDKQAVGPDSKVSHGLAVAGPARNNEMMLG